MKEEPGSFYFTLPEPQQSTLLALRSIILAFHSNIAETVKYGMPCFLYKRNIFCYLWIDSKTGEPYILMTEGNHLENPLLEKGGRSRMKILRIDPNEDIPLEVIHNILNEAIELYLKGVVKLK